MKTQLTLAQVLSVAKDRARDEQKAMTEDRAILSHSEKLRLKRINRFLRSKVTGQTLKTAEALHFINGEEYLRF